MTDRHATAAKATLRMNPPASTRCIRRNVRRIYARYERCDEKNLNRIRRSRGGSGRQADRILAFLNDDVEALLQENRQAFSSGRRKDPTDAQVGQPLIHDHHRFEVVAIELFYDFTQ